MRIRIRVAMEPPTAAKKRQTVVEADDTPLTESAASASTDSDTDADAGSESAATLLQGIQESIEGMLPILDLLDSKVQSITATVEAATNRKDLFRSPVEARDPCLQAWMHRHGVSTCRDILKCLFDNAEWVDIGSRTVRLAPDDAAALGLGAGATLTVFDLLRLLPSCLQIRAATPA